MRDKDGTIAMKDDSGERDGFESGLQYKGKTFRREMIIRVRVDVVIRYVNKTNRMKAS